VTGGRPRPRPAMVRSVRGRRPRWLDHKEGRPRRFNSAPVRFTPLPSAGMIAIGDPGCPDISPGLGSSRVCFAGRQGSCSVAVRRTRAGTPTHLRRSRTEPSLRDGLRPPWTARLPRQAWPGVEAGRGARTRRLRRRPATHQARARRGQGRRGSDESGSGAVDRAAFRPAGAAQLRRPVAQRAG